MGRLFVNLALLLLAALPSYAVAVRDSRVSASVDQRTCAAPKSAALFHAADRQVFLWFIARQVRPGDRVRVDWLDPSGAVSAGVEYGELPSAAEICFTTQLPVAGFAPATQPGAWQARVTANGRELFSKRFEIAADRAAGGPQVTGVAWRASGANEIDFTVRGAGFEPGAAVFIAAYTPSGGWRYLASLRPKSIAPDEIAVHYGGLPASEYLVIVENPDQRTSRPMPFEISTSGYKLPIAAGEAWVITQGPHGAFSHWGNSLQAYDIAPRLGRCVVAMKAGVVHAYDRGMRQDRAHRTFGNYITIDHGDGEYSHYAHLASGTFTVSDGERVERGQALARVGNSGYTLGEGGGYHVHVHVTRAPAISAQSIPFQFEDSPQPVRPGAQRVVASTNDSPLCNCDLARAGVAGPASPARSASRSPPHSPQLASAAPKQFSASVAVEQWWSCVVSVPARAQWFDASLFWKPADGDLDLHLVSPSGRHYGWYGDTAGYSGADSNPENFRLPRPEPGLWRVAVQAMRGGAAAIDFDLTTSGAKVKTPGPSLASAPVPPVARAASTD